MGIFDFLKKQDDFGKSLVEQEQIKKEHKELLSKEFYMIIEDVFSITGKGVVVTGKIVSGSASLNDILTIKETGKQVKIVGIEAFRKQLNFCQAGDNVGLLLSDVNRDSLKSGYSLIK